MHSSSIYINGNWVEKMCTYQAHTFRIYALGRSNVHDERRACALLFQIQLSFNLAKVKSAGIIA